MERQSKNTFTLIISVISCFFFLGSCNDIIKDNLSRIQLNVQSPPDSFRTNNYVVTFLWDNLDNAEVYHIQIVQPSFTNMQQLLLDTLVSDVKCTFSLFPGVYQWRIRAENSGSTTAYITRNIIVDSNSNLQGAYFSVNMPADNYITNATIIAFNWSSFPAANLYEYILTDSVNNVTFKDKVTTQNFILDTLVDGKYSWKVRALNTVNNTFTQFSTARGITIDVTAPFPSVPIKPLNNSLDTNAITLLWNRFSDVVGDSMFIATDSLFTNVITNLYTANIGYQLTPMPLNQPYYWRLRSRDLAGNWSVWSVTYKFTVIH